MLSLRHFDDWGLVVVTYSEPFSATDLIIAANAPSARHEAQRRPVCALVDLRGVDISGLTGSDCRKFALAKKERLSGQPSGLVAYWLKDASQFGTLRMLNQWAELVGMRDETDTYASTDLCFALKWLEDCTAQPGLTASIEADIRIDQERVLSFDQNLRVVGGRVIVDNLGGNR